MVFSLAHAATVCLRRPRKSKSPEESSRALGNPRDTKEFLNITSSSPSPDSDNNRNDNNNNNNGKNNVEASVGDDGRDKRSLTD